MAAGALVLAASVALATLSGCSLLVDPEPAQADPAPTASASPTPSPTRVPPPELDKGMIVATGQLVGDPLISGKVDVRVTGTGTFELRLLDFRSAREGDVELRFSPHVVEPGAKCTTSIMNVSYGNLPPGTHHDFPIMRDFTHGDPSFLDTVIISHYDPAAFERGCYVPVLASAILTWTLPDMRPGLLVVDSGRTGGANGDVAWSGGAPLTYTVAADDLAGEVAARFGITTSDLFYLNPTRTSFVPYPLLQFGEVLNLSKEHR